MKPISVRNANTQERRESRKHAGLIAVLITAILTAGGVGAFYIWVSHNRFQLVETKGDVAYEVDRRTGETWLLEYESKTRHKLQVADAGMAEELHKGEMLPLDALLKITGNGGFEGGFGNYFSGKLYNGSDWTVAKVVFTVVAKDNNGSVRWTRDLAHDVGLEPLTTGSFRVPVTGEEGATAGWSIKQAYGYRPK